MSNTENQAPEEQPTSGNKPRKLSQLGMFNFLLTVGLLVFGVISLFENLGNYTHPGDVINQALSNLHEQTPAFPVVTYATTTLTAVVGSLLLTLQGANFGIITWWAVTRMRARKVSFWVPPVGALISSTLTFLALIMLMLSDPAIIKALTDFISASH